MVAIWISVNTRGAYCHEFVDLLWHLKFVQHVDNELLSLIQLLYGIEVPRPTEVPRSKLGLDLRSGMDPECGTKMPKCELGLGLKIGSTALNLISLLCTALVSYKSESRSLTNARRDFPGQRRKANPTYHGMLDDFLGTSLPGISA